VNKRAIVGSIREERVRTLALLRSLEDEQWDAPALPNWRVREVVAHLITTDRASVTGRIIPQVLGSIEKVEAWNDRQVAAWAGRTIAEHLSALERWGRRFARVALAVPKLAYGVRVPTLWGRAPGGLVLWLRPYDEWVHRQDIRRALGQPDEGNGFGNVGEFLLTAMSYDIPRRMPGTRGSVRVALEGESIPEWGFDFTHRRFGAHAAAALDARITGAGHRFIMAAAGRDAFSMLMEEGSVKIEGDEHLAEAFLSKIRIV
jgi:uncharacterized protein (TIGR03083 family)